MYSYNDIALSIVSDLNTRILNRSFSKLIENDTGILPINEYTPKIWEHKWFNDNTIAGYSKGDAVWKYTMTSATFLSYYKNIIYDYASKNTLLNGYFKLNKGDTLTDDETERYLNVISGYGEYKPDFDINGNIQINDDGTVKQSWHQILPPLFEYGAYDTKTNHPIEIYISLLDNNKELLSNSLAWTNITLSTDNDFKQYISTELSLIFDSHVRDYHLNGINTSSDFNELLLKRDFSNFDVSALYNALKMTNHSKYINDLGFDYVIEFKKLPITTKINGTDYTLYKWCRLWNSGHLEHGGIIEIPAYNPSDINSISSNVSSYTLCVDLSWPENEILYYDYLISSNFYGSTTNNLYFRNNVTLLNYLQTNTLQYNNRYVISLTPVLFNAEDFEPDIYNETKIKLKDENICDKRYTYPSAPNSDINKTYVNFETHSITNKSFCITRSRTDDLTDNNTIRYILYYTSGYRSSTIRSYNMLSCEVKGLASIYEYTGSPVKPGDASNEIYVYTNDGLILTENVDYKLEWYNNVNPTLNAKVNIVGLDPYHGVLIKTFAIKIKIDLNDYYFKILKDSTQIEYDKFE